VQQGKEDQEKTEEWHVARGQVDDLAIYGNYSEPFDTINLFFYILYVQKLDDIVILTSTEKFGDMSLEACQTLSVRYRIVSSWYGNFMVISW
jgi:hypothetical protein